MVISILTFLISSSCMAVSWGKQKLKHHTVWGNLKFRSLVTQYLIQKEVSNMPSQKWKEERNRAEKRFNRQRLCPSDLCRLFVNTIPLFSIKLKVSGLNSRDRYVLLSRPWNYFCHSTLGPPFSFFCSIEWLCLINETFDCLHSEHCIDHRDFVNVFISLTQHSKKMRLWCFFRVSEY